MYGQEIPDKITGFGGTGFYGIRKCRVREYGEPCFQDFIWKASMKGNPQNYNPRGFETSCIHGIFAGQGLQLPAPECLMVKE
ncbi:hypothetical protein DFR60_11852 [Hungatella effluvii]|uniref:Uncharacterized protein n=1 Tax=Hungatella effluvii TaxID=1096246 RepID=A0A2V3XWX2_9FIRM|nr:hypothetical protein [Hungatella effluvii]PXX48173.1 hypothetical protein DFR60_11852 [Hungatella effluvii]